MITLSEANKMQEKLKAELLEKRRLALAAVCFIQFYDH